MFDVDYFKNYNDTNGHPAGDEVLRTIGQILKDSVTDGDCFARYGGEEFIICYSNVSTTEKAAANAEKFRKQVEDYPFGGEENQPGGNLTVSIGISLLSDENIR